MCGLGTERRLGDGALDFLTDGVAESPDAAALEDTSTRSVDMHGRGNDPESCAMDVTDIQDDERVWVLTIDAPNNET